MDNNKVFREVFDILDCDGDGFITLEDLRQAMASFEEDDEVKQSISGEDKSEDELSEKDLRDMIAEADSDQDGKIGFEDFLKVLSSSEKEGKEKHK